MKDSIDYPQASTVMQHNICSEKKYATCFENRGCIYEQYFLVAMQNMQKIDAGSEINIGDSTVAEQ